LDTTVSAESPEFGHYTFVAHRHVDGHPTIAVEPVGKGLTAVGTGGLSLRLRSGVDIQEALDLAAHLNDLVDGIEHTRVSRNPQ
jgi:hypothetical protein